MRPTVFSDRKLLTKVLLILGTIIAYVTYSKIEVLNQVFRSVTADIISTKGNDVSDTVSSKGNDIIELTLRMPATKNMVHLLLCDLLRSAVLFWDSSFGPVHIILDEDDRNNSFFPKTLAKVGLPFQFRFTYEKKPSNMEDFKKTHTKNHYRRLGYVLQLYSSFLMDLYTEAPVIAWTDTDVIMTQPILRSSIIRDGKLLAMGWNSFGKFGHVAKWNHDTIASIGLPMVTDFMTYFPVYVYRSTIRNCREFIMKRLNMTHKPFEYTFVKFATYDSPVNIIMSYAYYYERDRYSWHIDIDSPPLTLEMYNKKQLPPDHPLTANDVTPELHQGLHSKYYRGNVHPIEQAICYVQIAIGQDVTAKQQASLCKQFVGKRNDQLLEFEGRVSDVKTWCHGIEGRKKCDKLVQEQYSKFATLYQLKKLSFNTSYIKVVETLAKKDFDIVCPAIRYSKFEHEVKN